MYSALRASVAPIAVLSILVLRTSHEIITASLTSRDYRRSERRAYYKRSDDFAPKRRRFPRIPQTLRIQFISGELRLVQIFGDKMQKLLNMLQSNVFFFFLKKINAIIVRLSTELRIHPNPSKCGTTVSNQFNNLKL